MRWYSLFKKASPPSYIVERLSDLNYASEICEARPKEAIKVISNVISQLSAHHDENFVPALKETCTIMLDSPKRANNAIKVIMKNMISEKEEAEDEKKRRDEEPWLTK